MRWLELEKKCQVKSQSVTLWGRVFVEFGGKLNVFVPRATEATMSGDYALFMWYLTLFVLYSVWAGAME